MKIIWLYLYIMVKIMNNMVIINNNLVLLVNIINKQLDYFIHQEVLIISYVAW